MKRRVVAKNDVELHSHMVKDETQAFRHESEVSRFTPNKEKEAGIDEFTAPGIVQREEETVRGGDKRTPRGVIAEEFLTKVADYAKMEGIDRVWRRLQAHLIVGK